MTQKLQQFFCLLVGGLFLLGTANLNAQDTTNTVSVTFQVDMSQAIDSSHFDPAVHSVWIAGSMNGWDNSGTVDLMDDPESDKVYSITLDIVPGDIEYKFVASTIEADVLWENGENRVETITEATTLPAVPFNYYFNDMSNAQTVDIEVVFAVDMTSAIQFSGFDPAEDEVGVTGSFIGWANDFSIPNLLVLNPMGGSENVYEISTRLTDVLVPDPIGYKYVFFDASTGEVMWENIGNEGQLNREAVFTADGEEIEPGVFLNIIDARNNPVDFNDMEPIGVEMLSNGDFENGDDGSWYGNAFNIQTEGENSFNFADVAIAGNPWDVNLSQNVRLTPGQFYTLTFDAATSADSTRDMIAGIGLTQDPWYAATEVVTLSGTMETYTLELYATDDATGSDFGESSRVIFDMGADAGVVVIDNVSLVAAEEVPYEPVGPEMITSLADARLLVDQDTSVYVEFVVTSPDYGYAHAQFFGQDETGGMYFFIRNGGGEVNGPAVYPGQVMQYYGYLETFAGFVEFIPVDGAIMGTAEIPDPVYLNVADLTTDSPYLGMRVVVDMVDIVGDNWPSVPISSGGSVVVPAVADSVGHFDVIIDRGQSFYDGHPKPENGFTLAGNMNIFGDTDPRVNIAPFFEGDIVGTFEDQLNVYLPLYFEEDIPWADVITDFDGGFATVVDNPDQSGINESGKVLQMTKNAGQVWGGSFLQLTEPVLLEEQGFAISANVWAPRPDTRMLLKLENAEDPSIFVEAENTISESNAWTEVVFDLSHVDMSYDYTRVVMIFDLGTMGDGSADYTWYVDNLEYRYGGATENVHLTFAVDMTDAIDKDMFDPMNDVVAVAGSFNGWNTDFMSHNIMLLDYVQDNLYAADYVVFDQMIPEFYEYKYIYFDNDQGLVTWEMGENRGFETTKANGTDINGNYITYVHTQDNPAFFNTEQPHESYIEFYAGGVGGFAGEELMIPVYADVLHASTSSVEFEFANFAELGTFTGVYTDSTTLFEAYGWTMADNFMDDTLFVAAGGADNIDMSGILFYIGIDLKSDLVQGEYYIDMLWAAIDEDAPFYFDYYSEPIYISSPLLGDVSMNGDVRAYDASLVLKWLVDYIPLSDAQMMNGDVTEDGELTALDASYILEYVVRLVDFPITDTPEPTGIAEFGSPMLDNTLEATTIEVPIMVRDLENVKSLTGTINLGSDWFTNAEFTWSEDFSKFQREAKLNKGMLKFAAAGPLTAIADGTIGMLTISVESAEMVKGQTVTIDRLRWNEAGVQQAVSDVNLDLLITSLEADALPTEFAIGQNYPNPFNPSTTINFTLPENSDVQIVVYDMLGKEVATLVNKTYTAGKHNVTFNASQLSSGIYFYQIKAGSFIETKKMTLIK